MNKLAKHLIKLGHEKPDLRIHIRPILNKIAARPPQPLVILRGRPVYFRQDVLDPSSGIQKAQKEVFARQRQKILKQIKGGDLEKMVEQATKIKVFNAKVHHETTEIMVEDPFDDQNWSRMVITFDLVPNQKAKRLKGTQLGRLISSSYRRKDQVVCQLDELYIHNDKLWMEISWWGAIWSEDYTYEFEQRKDPAYIKNAIEEEVKYALERLSAYRGRYVDTYQTATGVGGLYRSSLPEAGYDYDDYYEDPYSDDPGESMDYMDAVYRETESAKQALEQALSDYKKHIKNIVANQGDENYIEVYVELNLP